MKEYTVEAWVNLAIPETESVSNREAIQSMLNKRFHYHSSNFTVDPENKTITARVQHTVMIDVDAIPKDVPFEQGLQVLAIEALKKHTGFSKEETVDQLDVF